VLIYDLVIKVLIKLEANSILFPLAVPIFERKLVGKISIYVKIIEINEIICATIIIAVTYRVSPKVFGVIDHSKPVLVLIPFLISPYHVFHQ
jgi:hypothetical protein